MGKNGERSSEFVNVQGDKARPRPDVVSQIGCKHAALLVRRVRAARVAGPDVHEVLPSETSESVGWQNFGRMLLVFGCIGSDFCKKICVLQHFSKSTRFSS